MDRLSGLDAMFLYLETPQTPMHIASLMVCEPPEGYEDNPYDAFRAQIASRIHEVPVLTRILQPTPLRLDHPVWVKAETIDLDYHIRRAALPKPGSAQQLRTMVEHLHTQVLDRTQPLWQYHVIEGLEGGRFALYLKSHHASLDGGGGVLALDILSDRAPTPRPPLPTPQVRLFTRKPGFFEMLGHAYGSLIQQQVNAVGRLPALARTVGRMVRSAVQDGTWSLGDLKPAPHTIFNTRIGRRRAWGMASMPLADVKALAKATGSTLNDVVLVACGGALRRYLTAHKALPEASLVAGVPVSLREVGDNNIANQVTSVFAKIGTHIADPIERLAFVKESMQRAKSQLKDVKDIVPRDFSVFGAPAIVPLLWQLIERSKLTDIAPTVVNVAISNVPGPRRPMYFAGIEVKEAYPVSIAAHGAALNITLQSYVNRLEFGLTACREVCPDVQSLTDGIVEEMEELRKAAAGRGPVTQPTAARPRRKRAATSARGARPKGTNGMRAPAGSEG